MADQVIDALIEGGKATAAPPLGPALGPAGVNIGQVVAEINKKTEAFKGMKVPVKVTVKDDKSFTISVGTPPVSALVKKEAGIEKGASNPLTDKVADLKVEQVIKIAKMKENALLGKDMVSKVKEIIGSCDSMGIMVEGKQAREIIADINKGEFVEKIKAGKTELSAEELKELAAEKKKLQEELEKRRKEYETTAKDIIAKMEGKARGEIKTKLVDAKIPSVIIEELLPAETKEGAKDGEKAAPKGGEKKAAPAKK